MNPVVLGAIIAAGPASLSAYASLRTNRRIRTNHGKTIGEHVEDQGQSLEALVVWASGMTEWAEHHTQQDADQMADIRLAVGLPPRPYVARPLAPPVSSQTRS